MSNEPGLTLSRLIAVERNSATGMSLAESSLRQLAELSEQVDKIKGTLVQQQEINAALNLRLAALVSCGATTKD